MLRTSSYRSLNSQASDVSRSSGNLRVSSSDVEATSTNSEQRSGLYPLDMSVIHAPNVCKLIPMVVHILLDLLEKRVPPLTNLSIGQRDKTKEEIRAISENLKRNSALGLSFEIQSIKDHSTGVLFEILRSYTERNFPDLFEPTQNFCRMSAIFLHVPDIHPSDKQYYITKELNSILKRMPSRRVALLSLLMRRFHIWVQMEIAHQMAKDSRKTSEEVKQEGFSYLADIFSSCLVHISERREVAVINNGVKNEDIEAFLTANLYGVKEAKDDLAKYEAEILKPLIPEDFLNATEYIREKGRQEHYAKIFATLRLAKENAKHDAERYADVKEIDWKQDGLFQEEANVSHTPSPTVYAHNEPERQYFLRSCEAISIKVVDRAGTETDRICLKKPLDWCSLFILLNVIDIDFWHKTALEIVSTQQERELMRRSRKGSWRRAIGATRTRPRDQ